MRQVGLVAIQQRLEPESARDLSGLERRLAALVEEGWAGFPGDLPTLVAFPKDTGTLLAFAEDGDLLTATGSRGGGAGPGAAAPVGGPPAPPHPTGDTIRALFLERAAPRAHQGVRASSSGAFARRYGCYLVAGSGVFPDHRLEDGEARLLPGPRRLQHQLPLRAPRPGGGRAR